MARVAVQPGSESVKARELKILGFYAFINYVTGKRKYKRLRPCKLAQIAYF